MNDLTTQAPAKTTRTLTPRFVVIVSVSLLLFALLLSLFIYLQVKHLTVQQDLNHFNESLDDVVLLPHNASSNNSQLNLQKVRGFLLAQERVKNIAIYSVDNKLIWTSEKDLLLNNEDKTQLLGLVKEKTTTSWVWDDLTQFMQSPRFSSLVRLFKADANEFSTLSVLRDENGLPIAVIKTLRTYSKAKDIAQQVATVSFVIIFFSALLFGIIFSRVFANKLNADNDEEVILNNQVAKLSVLLDENKELQQNMQSASSRAVELNERFLRRVGSDLHDGPAQSIGYALLRLNQVSSKQISEELGYEFHAVKMALSESLDEIRGISSGLVLPELEKMTLEEAIHKIIQKHKSNTNAEVKESYFNLPDEIALPIKICAYRFAQEGLNNAYKHGGATKCRFIAQVVDDALLLSLKDNGVGFRKSVLNSDGGHLGLVGLKDRIESLGGKLNINSELGVGTSLKVSIKIQ